MPNLDLSYRPEDRIRAFENHSSGHLISLAGPGTGKTYALLKRTEALRLRNVSQDTICYLTFIKEISNAFIQDYIQKFGQESYETNKPRISTLHSFACRLLRNQGFRIGYDGILYFSNATDTELDIGQTVLSDLLRFTSSPDCRTVPQLRKNIDIIKAAWRDTEDISSLPSPIPAILSQAESLFKAFRFVDWDQTIPLAHTLTRNLSELPRWLTEIKHYFIDEYQDFNKAEQALISFLSAQATSVVIVGDDDQSLYKSRGGSPDGLRGLYTNPAYDQVSLIKCFRCPETIVSAANRFQSSMHSNPRLMTPNRQGGQILVFRFGSSRTELAYLVEFLQQCITNMPESPAPKDGTVCLFPSWKTLEEYYKKLSPLIPCYKRKNVVDPSRLWLERILQLIVDPNQRFLERLLLNGFTGIKPRDKQLIVQTILERDVSVPSAVELLISGNRLSPRVVEYCDKFCALIDDVASRNVDRIVQHIVCKLNLDCQSIEGHLSEMIERLNESEREDLITSYTDLILPESANPSTDLRSVFFLTMHGSKGLTKKNVVMPGLEASWLPGNSTGDELNERKRLFYVALTRATDRVLITYPQFRVRNDSLNYRTPGRGTPSPFIADAGLRVVYHN